MLELDPVVQWLLVLIVAALYSLVGHGGASGYIGVLSLAGYSSAIVASTALTMNLLVAGVSFVAYRYAKYFDLRLLWPFAATSVPFAFIGSQIQLAERTYFLVVALVLLLAAARMFLRQRESANDEATRLPPLRTSLAWGAAVGLLSGIVGVGGGIFLSPLLMLFGWSGPKTTAAVSAAFILLNSAVGLGGRYLDGRLEYSGVLPLLAAGFLGAILGSYLGAIKAPGHLLRRALGVVLVLAALKMIQQYLATR